MARSRIQTGAVFALAWSSQQRRWGLDPRQRGGGCGAVGARAAASHSGVRRLPVRFARESEA